MSIESTIQQKLVAKFQPSHLNIVNESGNHNVPENSETHFKVTLVCDGFTGQRQVQRHQSVYQVLAEELQGSVHALALHTFDSLEWQEHSGERNSPPCMGGEKGAD